MYDTVGVWCMIPPSFSYKFLAVKSSFGGFQGLTVTECYIQRKIQGNTTWVSESKHHGLVGGSQNPSSQRWLVRCWNHGFGGRFPSSRLVDDTDLPVECWSTSGPYDDVIFQIDSRSDTKYIKILSQVIQSVLFIPYWRGHLIISKRAQRIARSIFLSDTLMSDLG